MTVEMDVQELSFNIKFILYDVLRSNVRNFFKNIWYKNANILL